MTTRTKNELSQAIENLYRIFKRHRPGVDFESCSHCVSETEDVALKKKRLTDITNDDISRYAFKAMTTWGTVEDFKHFLPRIFELVATSEDFPIEFEVAIGKLAYGKWQFWPDHEIDAIEQFLSAWWNATLSTPFSESTSMLADDVLCSLAQVVENLDPYLAHWNSSTDLEAGLHLAAFVDWNFDSLYKKDRIDGAFWKEELTEQQTVEWLRTPERRLRLERLCTENPRHPFAYLLSEAAQKLEWWTSKGR
jgi:hypothetical protein